jgi:hypothetical protein
MNLDGVYGDFWSSRHALGMILATGNVGEFLSFDETTVNTYLSRDGGQSWAEVTKGATGNASIGMQMTWLTFVDCVTHILTLFPKNWHYNNSRLKLTFVDFFSSLRIRRSRRNSHYGH